MALNIREIRKTLIDVVKLSIGDQLSQTTNPQTQETYGMVFNARPNRELPVPEYSYAVLDITDIKDTDWYLTNLRFNDLTQNYCYETGKTLTVQVSIFGQDSLLLADSLKTSFRTNLILETLSSGGIGVGDIEIVQILPELLQTDWLESAFVKMTIRANDISEDPSLDAIERIIVEGELNHTSNEEPLDIELDVSSPNYIP